MAYNTNRPMLDRPMWEQLTPLQAGSSPIAGSSCADDGVRYIYWMHVISTVSATFWRYDTWMDNWQQLATPPTVTITVGKLKYIDSIGSQGSDKSYGSILSLQGNGTNFYFYRYDIASNTWATLSTSGIVGTFATDVTLLYPEPERNNFAGGYHSVDLVNISTTAAIAVGATSVSVSALNGALPANARIRLASMTITTTSNINSGDTTIPVSALTNGMAIGTSILFPNGEEVVLSAAAASGATSLTVYPVRRFIPINTAITFDMFVVLTAAAASGATTLTISPSLYSFTSGMIGNFYRSMFMTGNNATQMYRYIVSTNSWVTTSANAGAPAITAIPGTMGAGCSLVWLPAYNPSVIFLLRGGTTSSIWTYNLDTNAYSILNYNPSMETFGGGTSVAVRSIGGKQSSFLISQNAGQKIFEFDPRTLKMNIRMNQWLYPVSGALVGDRTACLISPDGIEFYYIIIQGTQMMARCAMIDC